MINKNSQNKPEDPQNHNLAFCSLSLSLVKREKQKHFSLIWTVVQGVGVAAQFFPMLREREKVRESPSIQEKKCNSMYLLISGYQQLFYLNHPNNYRKKEVKLNLEPEPELQKQKIGNFKIFSTHCIA